MTPRTTQTLSRMAAFPPAGRCTLQRHRTHSGTGPRELGKRGLQIPDIPVRHEQVFNKSSPWRLHLQLKGRLNPGARVRGHVSRQVRAKSDPRWSLHPSRCPRSFRVMLLQIWMCGSLSPALCHVPQVPEQFLWELSCWGWTSVIRVCWRHGGGGKRPHEGHTPGFPSRTLD